MAMHAAPTVRMYVAEFGREVLIDEQHPFAVAQRARNADLTAQKAAPSATPASAPSPAVTTDTPLAVAPAVRMTPDSPAPATATTAAPRKKKGKP